MCSPSRISIAWRNSVVWSGAGCANNGLLALAALLVLSVGPVFGHHLSSRLELLLAGRDHLWALCLVALHHLFAPVHDAFHLLVGVGLVYALWDRWRAWLLLRDALAPIEEFARLADDAFADDAFATAARRAGLRPSQLRIVDRLPSPAFTAGWWRPQVYVARELADQLSPAELAAVLAHEGAHLTRRDPLRLAALRFLSRLLFWLPALRRLATDAADEAEILADDIAAAREDALTLASALVQLGAWRAPRGLGPAAVGLSAGLPHADLLERRVRRLAGEAPPSTSHVTRRSIAGAAVVLALVWTSGVLMAHPLPGNSPTHPAHCVHRGEWALSHLFCLGSSPIGADAASCPHLGR